MPELAAQLSVRADLDLGDLFAGLAQEVLGVDLGDTTFDPGALLARVRDARPPALDGLRSSIDATVTAGSAHAGVVLPAFSPPRAVADLAAALGSLDDLVPALEPPSLTGLDGLGARLDVVRGAVTSGPVADLLALVPGLSWSAALGRLGGDVGGAVELLRVLAGLLATASASRELVDRTGRFVLLLDREQAELSATMLLAATTDTRLPDDLRAADPEDATAVEELTARVSAFAEAVSEVSLVWSQGMGYGEAALPLVDVAGVATGLEVARLALGDADLAAVGALAGELRRLGQPLLDLPLPAAVGDGFAARTARLVADLTTRVEDWDVAASLDPVTDVAALATAPVTQFREVVAGLEVEVSGRLRTLRGIVDEIDLAPVAAAVQEALRPVTDLLDGIEQEVAAAQGTLTRVAQGVAAGLDGLTATVGGVAGDLTEGLGEIDTALGELGLDRLAAALSEALRSVADALGSAQLSPYFDTAVEVIGTAADVLDAIPFGMLPTDVQQAVVDACRPLKQLDLQEVEDALRGELAAVREEFRGDLLADVERAYREVVTLLASLDPGPHLAALEAGPFAELRTRVDEVDPSALLAPVGAAIEEVRGLLDGLDLDADLLQPLRGVVQPVLDAIDELDPAALLAPVAEQVDGMRESVSGLLHLEAAAEALQVFRERAADLLDRIDPAGVASVLDARLVDTLLRDSSGPPGGALGAVLVAVAEASGFRADEAAVQDVLDWVSGRADAGPVVRGRIEAAAANVLRVSTDVAALDPGPVATATAAYRRALTDAVAVHAEGTGLRLSVDPLLAASPAGPLGLLAANRQRYRTALDADVAILATMSASGRTEVAEAAAGVAAALAPLSAFPARLRDALAAAGLDPARPGTGTAWRQALLGLVVDARAAGLTDALVDLVGACRGRLRTALDTVVGAGLDAVGTVGDVVALLDLEPVVAELSALHQRVRGEVAALAPDALLGDVVAQAHQVVDRLQHFDPLAPVRDVVDAALRAADRVFESVRPTTVFAPAVSLHARVTGLAAGLDVVSLLRPVLEALDAIAGQLDSGFDRTGGALADLQASLPDHVVENALDVAVGVDIGVSL